MTAETVLKTFYYIAIAIALGLFGFGVFEGNYREAFVYLFVAFLNAIILYRKVL